MLTLAQIQKEAFSTACAKGWHDRPLFARVSGNVEINHDRVLRAHALMHSEVSEAFDALEWGDLALRVDEASSKPEGFVVELADFVIRVCDTTAALGVQLWLHDNADLDQTPDWIARTAETHPAVWELTESSDISRDATTKMWLGRLRLLIDKATEAVRVDEWRDYAQHLTAAVLLSAAICVGLDLDLATAIEEKMRYNQSRPHRHGGKKA